MSFMKSMDIVGSALTAERFRMGYDSAKHCKLQYDPNTRRGSLTAASRLCSRSAQLIFNRRWPTPLTGSSAAGCGDRRL